MPTEESLKNEITGEIEENMFFVFRNGEADDVNLTIENEDGDIVWDETADSLAAGAHFFYLRVVNNNEFDGGDASGEYTWTISSESEGEIISGTFTVD